MAVHFWAPWAPQCAQMNDVFDELAKVHPYVKFLKVCRHNPRSNGLTLPPLQVQAEEVPELSEKYEISAVPTFVLFKVCSRPGPYIQPKLLTCSAAGRCGGGPGERRERAGAEQEAGDAGAGGHDDDCRQAAAPGARGAAARHRAAVTDVPARRCMRAWPSWCRRRPSFCS